MSAPPPPPPPTFNISSGSNDQGRNVLLESIRAGKTLKKTVTNDKSAPLVSGRIQNAGSNNSPVTSPTSSSLSNNNPSPSPLGLGGLFAGGMPKLKSTGLRGAAIEKNNLSPIQNTSSGNSHSSISNSNNSSPTSNTLKRGPPPVPPSSSQKPTLPQLQQHVTDGVESIHKGFGKPVLAPKPPGTATLHKNFPPKKPDLPPGGISRAQSMRLPRSPLVSAPSPPSIHQSQDCLNETQQRPVNRILKPPVAKPPVPPIARPALPPSINVGSNHLNPVTTVVTTTTTTTTTSSPTPTTTRVAPPPPSRPTVTAPSMPPPPPPPPHRSNLSHQRLPPPPPPTPPTRNLSLSNGQSTNNHLDFELRFSELFHSIVSCPQPEPFRAVPKFYSSKNAKQQAPAPPSGSPNPLHHTNARNKQWQQNAC